jgi:hypothetical protein
MIHRDISYTNILLRDPEVEFDSPNKSRIREELMMALDLSDIMKLRQDLKCREGLLIDLDYGSSLLVNGQNDTEAGRETEVGGATEGDKNDGTGESQHSVSSFPRQEPSGSRTVNFSILKIIF